MNGRGDKIRTCDLMLPKHARYQLRYTPLRKRHPLLSSRGAMGQEKEHELSKISCGVVHWTGS
jgi:hypothetical protein